VCAVASLLCASTARAQLDVPPEPPNLPPPPDQKKPRPPPTPPPPDQPPPAQPLAPPPPGSPYQSFARAHRPSPTWTQDRNFTSTRFWLLDPGQVEFETWLRTRVQHEFVDPATGMRSRAPAELLFQHEVEIGVFPHVQLDLYENLTFNVEDDGHRGVQQEGVQLEARIAIPSYYGQIFGNPVIYLEWHPRHNDADRAEVRILLGGQLHPRVFLALNPYFETNVEQSGAGCPGAAPCWILDAEVGTTIAVGVKITDWLRASAELKIGGDMLGDPNNKFHFVAWAGPGFIVKPLPGKLQHYLKIMGTLLIDLVPRDDPNVAPQLLEPLFIVATQL
jgi:hypothetical protein